MNSVSGKREPVRILHLEDSSFDIELIHVQLGALTIPYSLKQVTTEEAFKAELSRSTVDIVVSDSNLPGFDAGGALTFVREHHPEIPFIFFSGHLSPEVQERALSDGACAFIDKNDPGRLISVIEQFCKGAGKLPVVGHGVIVQCKGFRCLACLTENGKWVDFLHRRELPEVLSWYDPAS
jgi:CheY-like chemotaxis protein